MTAASQCTVLQWKVVIKTCAKLFADHVLQDVIKHDLAYLGNLLGHFLADSSMLLAPSWATPQLLQLPDSNVQGASLYGPAPQAMCSVIHLRIPEIIAIMHLFSHTCMHPFLHSFAI